MTSIDRRSLLTRGAIGAAVLTVAAVPAVASVGADGEEWKAQYKRAKVDPLLKVIGRYRAEIAAVNASHGLSDEELDAWCDRADAILVEAVGLPVLTAASAMAVIDLFVEDQALRQHCDYGNEFSALVRAARNYIALTVQA